ncbi:MAG: hypothetical protein Q9217_005260 [Psora testacea]
MSSPEESINAAPEPLFRSSIMFDFDDTVDPVLSSSTRNNDEDEQHIPRELIAAEVRSSQLIAELERPIRVGTFNDLTAFLLCFRFSFQRILEGYFKRIRAAEIEITFVDAPTDGTVGRNPSIVRFHPVLYEGPVSQGTLTYTSEINSKLVSVAGGPTAGASVSREVSLPQESRLVVHGTRDGRPTRNKIVWTIEEDKILEKGMPREMKMPLIVNMKDPRRFSAKVIVAAHYVFKRGLLARTFPVIGKYDDPLYFDPAVLENIANTQSQTGPDGRPIAEMVGILDANFLNTHEYSSFAIP